jgi:hypothetical protein
VGEGGDGGFGPLYASSGGSDGECGGASKDSGDVEMREVCVCGRERRMDGWMDGR